MLSVSHCNRPCGSVVQIADMKAQAFDTMPVNTATAHAHRSTRIVFFLHFFFSGFDAGFATAATLGCWILHASPNLHRPSLQNLQGSSFLSGAFASCAALVSRLSSSPRLPSCDPSTAAAAALASTDFFASVLWASLLTVALASLPQPLPLASFFLPPPPGPPPVFFVVVQVVRIVASCSFLAGAGFVEGTIHLKFVPRRSW